MTPRERQLAIYDAEALTLQTVSRVLDTKAEVEDFLVDVVERHGMVVPPIDWRSGSMTRAAASDGAIHLPNNPHGRSVATVIHELAHFHVGAEHGHNHIWLDAYLPLIREEMGFMAWANFRSALLDNGVRV